MNSIESFSPPKIGSLDGEASDAAPIFGSDPIALEALRAMIGGVVPQQLGFQQHPATTTEDTPNTSAKLIALLTRAIGGDGLPPSLAPLIQSLVHSLTTKAPASSHATPDADAGLSTLRTALGQASAPTTGTAVAMPQPVASTAVPTAAPALDLHSLPPEIVEQMKQLLTAFDSAESSQGLPPGPAGSLVATPSSSPLQEIRAALAQALAAPEEHTAAKPITIEQQPNEASLGQSILQSLGAQSSAATASNVAASQQVSGAPTVERVEQVSALMTEMADRVLVTDPIHGQVPEVRVKLADNIMPGTEVRVWRENTGELRVAFDTNSSYWARVLNDASPVLAQRLNDRLPLIAPPQIIVQQQGGQPQDGRSRNRQNPWEVAQDALAEA